jgi:hypothetical protein
MGANETHRKSSDRPVIRHFQAWASGLPNNRLCIDRAVVAGDQQPSISAGLCAWRHRSLVTERDWQRVASDAIGDVLDRRPGVRASGDLGAAAGAPIAGSILPARPDLAVAGDPLSILPPWRGRGGLSKSKWNRPSSLAEYPPSGFPGGAEQVPP